MIIVKLCNTVIRNLKCPNPQSLSNQGGNVDKKERVSF